MSSKERELEISIQEDQIHFQKWKCCLNCDHGRELIAGHPCLKWNAIPPLDVLMVGCNSWEGILPF